MDRQTPAGKLPLVVQDSVQSVQLSITAATTDLHFVLATHNDLLDAGQRKLLQSWYKQLDQLGREIGNILGG